MLWIIAVMLLFSATFNITNMNKIQKQIFQNYIWTTPILRELTLMIFHMGLIRLGSEASLSNLSIQTRIYFYFEKVNFFSHWNELNMELRCLEKRQKIEYIQILFKDLRNQFLLNFYSMNSQNRSVVLTELFGSKKFGKSDP